MKMNLTEFPAQSSFATAQKDLFRLVQLLVGNENLKRMLFYQTKDALVKPRLTSDQTLSLLNKNIRVIPKLSIEEDTNAYVIITFDNFVTNATNPEFRDNTITFDIICHLNSWVMDNYQLRPYMIMGEIDSMVNLQKLNGIGTAEFLGANQLLLSDELAGYTLTYRVINDV